MYSLHTINTTWTSNWFTLYWPYIDWFTLYYIDWFTLYYIDWFAQYYIDWFTLYCIDWFTLYYINLLKITHKQYIPTYIQHT